MASIKSTNCSWASLRARPGMDILFVYSMIFAACVVAGLLWPESFRFLSLTNLSIALKSIPLLGIIAVGVGLLMITGQFDLSVGSVFTLTSMITALAFNAGWPILPAAVLGLSVGFAAGLINGAITVYMGIPSFITTLGTMLIFRGSTRYLADGHDVLFKPDAWFQGLMTGKIGLMQAQFIWLIVAAILGYILLNRHRLGNHMMIVGGSERTAKAMGISVNAVKMMAFAISGFLASFSGILSAVRVSSVSPSQGAGLELQAIAICVVGGVLLTGGRGTILGIVLGSFLLFTIQDALLLMRAPGFYLDVFVGAIIIVAVTMNSIVARSK